MDTALHTLISERLDDLKRRGLVSDYLVAWRGLAGQLEPRIAVWGGQLPDAADLARELAAALAGLVAPAAVTVREDGR
jgi:hypothetical protein